MYSERPYLQSLGSGPQFSMPSQMHSVTCPSSLLYLGICLLSSTWKVSWEAWMIPEQSILYLEEGLVVPPGGGMWGNFTGKSSTTHVILIRCSDACYSLYTTTMT